MFGMGMGRMGGRRAGLRGRTAAWGEDRGRMAMGPFGGDFGGGRGFGPEGFGGGGFGGGRGGGPRHGGGHRRGKRFEGEELRLMVLALLAQTPQHGYQLIRSFAEKSGGAYQPSPGVLYPMLTMLADMELVAEVAGEGTNRRLFTIIEAGEAELAEKQAQVDALFAKLAALAQMAEKTDGAPVRRAVHNLRSAIVERLGREGAAEDLAFEVAKIIDEATQKIERL
jgi:DNA-binding PadR family transcriptional regulator